ncbi:hypothetical protein ACK8P5_25865 (plasmid) [Paenibacillus sp. EC2-1]|uniref:hypothetical protein n=1 Tax=Paenibacillus sp. EC2-1 TaxID=3388665 RepID=UPI003BEEB2AA
MKKDKDKGYGYALKNKAHLEFLGYCDQKGFVYSEYLGDESYRVISLNNGELLELIRFTGDRKDGYDY